MGRRKHLELYHEASAKTPARRIHQPALISNDSTIQELRARRAELDTPLPDDTLREVMGIKDMTAIRRGVMLDLLRESYKDATLPPNSNTVKKRIYKDFREITGLSLESTGRIWRQCNQEIDKVLDIGLLSNYGATVLTDVIGRVYEDLAATKDTLDENGVVIKPGTVMRDHVRLGFYKTLMEAADMLLGLGVKQKANDINIDKNTILKQKVDNDAKLGAADVVIRIKDMGRDEREKAALDALFGDKTLLNPIFDQITSLEAIDANFTEL